MSDEYQGEKNGKRMWTTRTKNNHLGDCEKMQRVGVDKVEAILDDIREARRAKKSSENEKAES